MLSRTVSGECKAFVLRSRARRALRVLLLNKANARDCSIDVSGPARPRRAAPPRAPARVHTAAPRGWQARSPLPPAGFCRPTRPRPRPRPLICNTHTHALARS